MYVPKHAVACQHAQLLFTGQDVLQLARVERNWIYLLSIYSHSTHDQR
jgi:hypothetical protein